MMSCRLHPGQVAAQEIPLQCGQVPSRRQFAAPDPVSVDVGHPGYEEVAKLAVILPGIAGRYGAVQVGSICPRLLQEYAGGGEDGSVLLAHIPPGNQGLIDLQRVLSHIVGIIRAPVIGGQAYGSID